MGQKGGQPYKMPRRVTVGKRGDISLVQTKTYRAGWSTLPPIPIDTIFKYAFKAVIRLLRTPSVFTLLQALTRTVTHCFGEPALYNAKASKRKKKKRYLSRSGEDISVLLGRRDPRQDGQGRA